MLTGSSPWRMDVCFLITVLAPNQSLHVVGQVGGHNYVLKAEWHFPREAGLL